MRFGKLLFTARLAIAGKKGKRGGLEKRSQDMKNTLLSHEILTHDLLHDMKLLHVHYIFSKTE